MNEGFSEPRTPIWARAEVCWTDDAGQALRTTATLHDTSPSGACIRVKTPISVGSNLSVKWHREEFSGVARNCRPDGQEFLLGVQRERSGDGQLKVGSPTKAETGNAPIAGNASKLANHPKSSQVACSSSPTCNATVALAAALGTIGQKPSPVTAKVVDPLAAPTGDKGPVSERPVAPEAPQAERVPPQENQPAGLQARETSHPTERKAMESKGMFPKFWNRHSESNAAQAPAPTEHSPAAPQAPADAIRGSVELMAYEDIYHAAGILSSRSGFGIHKVLEMLNSERIRDLAPEIQRASVLMAIEAAGATADEILQDAQRRQHALDTYEAVQQKQVDEFAGHKTKENSQIRAEMEKVAAHYAERMQRNDDQVTQEKQALRDWQMAKQHESQRIADVMKLCSREPAPAAVSSSATAAAKAGVGAGPSASGPFGPSLVPGGQA